MRDDLNKLPLPPEAKSYARRQGLAAMKKQPQSFIDMEAAITGQKSKKHGFKNTDEVGGVPKAIKEAAVQPDENLLQELIHEAAKCINLSVQQATPNDYDSWAETLINNSTDKLHLRATPKMANWSAACGRSSKTGKIFVLLRIPLSYLNDPWPPHALTRTLDRMLRHELIHHEQSSRSKEPLQNIKARRPAIRIPPTDRRSNFHVFEPRNDYYSDPEELMARAYTFVRQFKTKTEAMRALRGLTKITPGNSYYGVPWRIQGKSLDRFRKYAYDYINQRQESITNTAHTIIAILLEADEDYHEWRVFQTKDRSMKGGYYWGIETPSKPVAGVHHHAYYVLIPTLDVSEPELIPTLEGMMRILAKDRTYPDGSFFTTPWGMYLIHGGTIGKI